MIRMADISGLITICRKAGKLVMGMDETKNACRSGRALGVIAASDLSAKSLKEISFVCASEGVPLYKADMTMDEIGMSLGKTFGILAVTDSGFMKACAKKLVRIELTDRPDEGF